MQMFLPDMLVFINMSGICQEHVSETVAIQGVQPSDILDIVNLQENKNKNKNT